MMQFKIAAESSPLVKDVPKSCEATHQKLVEAVKEIAKGNVDPIYDGLTFRIACYLGLSSTVIALGHKDLSLLTEHANDQFTVSVAHAMHYPSLMVYLLESLTMRQGSESRPKGMLNELNQYSGAAVRSMLTPLNYTVYHWLSQRQALFGYIKFLPVLTSVLHDFDGSVIARTFIDLLAQQSVNAVYFSSSGDSEKSLLNFVEWLRTLNSSPLSNLAKDAYERFITQSIDQNREAFESVLLWSKSNVLKKFADDNPEWMERTLRKNGFYNACVNQRTEDMWLLYKMRPKTIDSIEDIGRVFSEACAYGHIHVIETLLAIDPALISSWRDDVLNGFYEACKSGHTDIGKLLHAHDSTLLALKGKSCLESACYAGHLETVRWLRASITELSDGAVETHRPYFEAACSGYQFEVITELLKSTPELDSYAYEDPKLEFLFHCYNGDDDSVDISLSLRPTLIEANTNPKSFFERSTDSTGFHIACECGHYDLVHYFLKYHRSVLQFTQIQDFHGRQPKILRRLSRMDGLGIACREGHLKVAELLLAQAAAEPESMQSDTVHTAFEIACMYGQLHIVKHILRNDQSVLQLGMNQDSGFRFACYNGQIDVVKYLLRRCRESILADERSTPPNGLTLAIRENSPSTLKGRLQVIELLLETDPTLLSVADGNARQGSESGPEEENEEIAALLRRFNTTRPTVPVSGSSPSAFGSAQPFTSASPSTVGTATLATGFGSRPSDAAAPSFIFAPARPPAAAIPLALGSSAPVLGSRTRPSDPVSTPFAFGPARPPAASLGSGTTPTFGPARPPAASLGSGTTPTFGAASSSAAPSAFGAASSSAAPSTFGAASSSAAPFAFGAASSSAAPSAFGAASRSAAPSAFGAASRSAAPFAFGAASSSAAPSAFGAASSSAAPSAFGAASSSAAPSAFGAASSSAAPP